MTEYYLISYRLYQCEGYFIWATNDDNPDRILLDESGDFIIFAQVADAVKFAAEHGWQIEPEQPVRYDFDLLEVWIASPDSEAVNCNEFLNMWNLFTDASVSVSGHDFAPRSELNDVIYDKLFYGCNLPSITPAGEHYEPMWPPEHLNELVNMLRIGLEVFEAHLSDSYTA